MSVAVAQRQEAAVPEIAVAIVEVRHVEAVFAAGPPSVGQCADRLGWRAAPFDGRLAEQAAKRLHFGGEFCETLLPSLADLRRVVELVERRGTALTLVTPLTSDRGLDKMRQLLPLLPAGSEVVANDWGLLPILHREFPQLRPVAGRVICKMVKDPRLPSAEWGRLYPHGIHSRPFTAMLARFGVRRIEMDVPTFATPADFRSPSMAVSVHAPYSFSVKGRSCKIGSLNQRDGDKFTTGHACRRECLAYATSLARAEGGGDLPTVQRGTTIFFRHSPEMADAVDGAAAEGWIDRLILAGDWT